MMETDDIIAFSSYPMGMEILGHYGLQCEAEREQMSLSIRP